MEQLMLRVGQKAAYTLWLNLQGWDLDAAAQMAHEIVEGPAAPLPHMEPGWLEQSLPAVEEWMYQRFVVQFQWDLLKEHVTRSDPWERWLDPPLIELADDIGERCATAADEHRARALLR